MQITYCDHFQTFWTGQTIISAGPTEEEIQHFYKKLDDLSDVSRVYLGVPVAPQTVFFQVALQGPDPSLDWLKLPLPIFVFLVL